MKSFLTNLECTYCGIELSADEPHRTCPDCGKVLYPRYDLQSASAALKREDLKERPPNMWRYFEVMPVLDEANVVTLGEGFTPIFKTDRLATDTGCSSLFIKDEGLNPTASFKARGLGAAVSKAKELGITKPHHAIGGQRRRRHDRLCSQGGHGSVCLHAQGRARSQPRRS